ncbi:hypothetical protein BJV82DRAFT_631167, partial [Fennellomyces sp. T-0311]
ISGRSSQTSTTKTTPSILEQMCFTHYSPITQALKTKNLVFKHRLAYVNKYQVRVLGRGRKTADPNDTSQAKKEASRVLSADQNEESSSSDSSAEEVLPVRKGKGRAVVTSCTAKNKAGKGMAGKGKTRKARKRKKKKAIKAAGQKRPHPSAAESGSKRANIDQNLNQQLLEEKEKQVKELQAELTSVRKRCNK